MNIKKMKDAMTRLKDDAGDGLLASDIFMSADGQSIHGYNSQPKASALFTQVTNFLGKSLKSSGFPELGRYYIVDLVDSKMVVVIPLGDYQWGMLVDTKKTQMGLLLNVVLPGLIDMFEDAVAS